MQLKKWGNSFGVRIPKSTLQSLGVDENDDFEVLVDEKSKTITLKFNDHLTPYQRIMARSKRLKSL